MTMPSSRTRLVEASRNASAGTRPAPLAKIARVVASAAKLHELEMNPKKIPFADAGRARVAHRALHPRARHERLDRRADDIAQGEGPQRLPEKPERRQGRVAVPGEEVHPRPRRSPRAAVRTPARTVGMPPAATCGRSSPRRSTTPTTASAGTPTTADQAGGARNRRRSSSRFRRISARGPCTTAGMRSCAHDFTTQDPFSGVQRRCGRHDASRSTFDPS